MLAVGGEPCGCEEVRGRRQKTVNEEGAQEESGKGWQWGRGLVQVSASDLSLLVLQCLAAPEGWLSCGGRALHG